MDKKAVGIKYIKENLDVPVVTAKGKGKFAEKIIEEAVRNNIKIVENNDFFKFEELLTVNDEIPADVYKIVAEILSSIINTNKGMLDA